MTVNQMETASIPSMIIDFSIIHCMRKLSKRFLQDRGVRQCHISPANCNNYYDIILLVLDHDWFSADVGAEEVKESRGKATGATSMQGIILLYYIQ